MTILGISVGTARTGVCVLKDEVLLDRNVHSYHAAWSDHKLRVILNRYKLYIQRYNVTAIIVKIPPLNKHTAPLKRLLRRIEAIAKEYDCAFDLITKSEIKSVLSLRSTDEIIRYATLLYPELAALYDKGSPGSHSYYKKLYEAIVAAHIYQRRHG